MDDLLYFNINEKYNIFNITNDLATGDLGKVIAGHKFYELSNLISSANYSIEQANESQKTTLKSYLLRYAILDYNACYDYFEQIIYFAFDFFPEFYTHDEYLKILKSECRRYKNSNFLRNIQSLIESNQEAKEFFEEYDKRRTFVNDESYGIREWANNIKHQGGFWFEENLKKHSITKCVGDNGSCLFSTENLIVYKVSYEEVFSRLLKQNEQIVEFANWLFSYIFGDTKHICIGVKKERFSVNKNQFQKLKTSIIYGTEQ